MEGEGSSKNNYKNASTIYITQSRDTLNQRHNQKFKMAQICRLNCPLFSFGACDLPAMTVKLYVAFLQLYHGVDKYGLAASWLSGKLPSINSHSIAKPDHFVT